MKKTILATALAGMMLAGGAAQALTMKLVSYVHPHAIGTMNGATFDTGVLGTFEIVEDNTNLLSIHGITDEIVAMCLETNENISLNINYTFGVVDLAAAPTSDAPGMGVINSQILADYAYNSGFAYDTDGDLIGDLTDVEMNALQILQYESRDDSMDLTDDLMKFSDTANAGYADAAAYIAAGPATLPDGLHYQGFGLLNLGLAGSTVSTMSIAQYQDFAFYTVNDSRDYSVPEPASWVLMGSGLAGLGFIRRRKVRNI